jgi:hypothetical protein
MYSPAQEIMNDPILKKAKVYEYRPPKFFNDYVVAGLNNTVYVSINTSLTRAEPARSIHPMEMTSMV